MKVFTDYRFLQNDYGTFACRWFDEEPLCYVFEPPWQANETDISCIPKGSYVAELYKSPKRGYDVYCLQNVPGRVAIENHIGNIFKDTDGCQLLGMRHGMIWTGLLPWKRKVYHGVLDSKTAFKLFMDAAGGDKQIRIEIVGPEGIF